MIEIVVCTNRKASNSEKMANLVLQKMTNENAKAQILNLQDLDWSEVSKNQYGSDNTPESFKPFIDRVNKSEGLYLICPEYNGSFPGVIKTFIDHWSYPESFEKRAVCFMGLGGMFGGLRPVEHLQQVFGYRNSFIFPERIFLQNVWSLIDENGEIKDKVIDDLLNTQVHCFIRFIKGLEYAGLHALCKNTELGSELK